MHRGELLDYIEIEILNWDKYHPRSDIKRPWWFALNNTITTDDDLCEFSDAEFRAWIHILCTSSVQRTYRPRVFFKAALGKANIKRATLLSAIDKLQILQIIRIPATIRTDSVRDPNSTEEEKREERDSATDVAPEFPLVAKIWNEEAKSRPKVRVWSRLRERASKPVAVSSWTEAIAKVEASDFLSGRSGKWTGCGIDWLLKPANLAKVLEGNYDNSSNGIIPAGSLRGA